MDKRKIFSIKEVLLILPIIIVGALIWLFFSLSPKADSLVIEKNGQVVESLSLLQLSEPKEIVVEGEITVKIMVSSDGAWVEYSECPDKVCVRTGKITAAGESALCLPARVSIRLVGSGGSDGVTY